MAALQWIDPGLPGENGLLIFNNGRGRPSSDHSSVEEIITPVTPGGTYTLPGSGVYGPASPVWTYSAVPPNSFSAPFVSGAQRQANGNTLICNGPAGLNFEVTTSGVEKWRYLNPVGATGPVDQGETDLGANSVFRATRYAGDYPGLIGRDLTPHGTVEGNPEAVFQVITVSTTDTETAIRWNSIADQDYQILYRADLNTGPWVPIDTVTAIGSEGFYVDSDLGRRTLGTGFYRVSSL